MMIDNIELASVNLCRSEEIAGTKMASGKIAGKIGIFNTPSQFKQGNTSIDVITAPKTLNLGVESCASDRLCEQVSRELITRNVLHSDNTLRNLFAYPRKLNEQVFRALEGARL